MAGFPAGSAMNSCHYLRCSAANPEAVLDRALAEFAAGATGESLLAVDFSFCSYWQEGQPREPLVALYHLRRAPAAVRIDAAVLPGGGDFDSRWQARGAAADAWLDTLDVARFDLAQPLPLAPVAIPKPWGRELWYTGIERRGVAAVCRDGRSAPLPGVGRNVACRSRVTKKSRTSAPRAGGSSASIAGSSRSRSTAVGTSIRSSAADRETARYWPSARPDCTVRSKIH